MLKNYFKIGWRNLLEGRSYSLINVSGLAIGMAVTTLIGLWIFDELNRNRNFQNYDRIAKVYHHLSFDASIYSHDGVPAPMGNELKSNYPDFENVAVTTNTAEHVLAFGETKLSASGMFVDPDFFGIFSVQLSHGTTGIRNNLRSVVLSKTLAANLVGDNAVGKIVKLDNKDELIIAGTFEDFPANCQFGEVKMLMPFDLYFTLNDPNGKQKNSWENYDFQCFVLMRPDITVADADSKIINIGFDKGGGAIKAIKPKGFLFPMGKWHLYTEFKDGKNVGGKIQFLWMFGMVGAFVLVLACINFMNLSTGRSEKRSKEVGIRKVMGSTRPQLIGQFLSESALVVIVAFFASIIIVIACIPWFNQLANKQMNVPWTNSYFLMITFGFIFLTSVLAGSYPALYLSAFNPIRVLKGNFRASRFAAMPRKILVVFQFTISTALVIGTIVVFQQIQHAKDRPVGFDRDGIIFINVRTADLANTNYNTLRSELIRTGVVANMAKSDFPITGGASADPTLTWQGKDPSFRPLVAFNSCSHDFPATNGFQIVEGRDFSRDFASDSTAVLINETAARLISEDKSPLGKKITFGNGNEGEIIGVIKDQVRNSPFSTQWP
ncbi:MAG TPA: ABC transporter permease, partial [Cyclobacteriaceae bacterium]|nr:ABC transporter permease [Cyclobacteriaceae bacterium]